MAVSTRLLLVPLLMSLPLRPPLEAQKQAATDRTPVTVRWNRLVPVLGDQAAANRRVARTAAKASGDTAALRRIAQGQPPMLFRIYTLLSVAQYGAASSARVNGAVPADVAVASASAAVLSDLFTDSAVRASIARELAVDLERAKSGARGAAQMESAQRVGADVAAHVIASAPPLANLVAPWNGTIPKGPGMWYSAPGIPPIGILMAQARPWLLDSPAQFRPAPPPVYASPTFQSALEEVRRVARERTPEQTKIAQDWNESDPWARWNDVAAAAVRRHNLSEVDAARVFALLNVAASDAIIACFDAKYHYWSIRPSQADTTLVLADSVQLPNFPSYPSGHACSAGAFDGALAAFFPQDRAEFKRMAEEQAMSRLYGGIHYRFDNDGGLALGRTVAKYEVEREKRGGFKVLRTAGMDQKR